jgi:hypothetical protein
VLRVSTPALPESVDLDARPSVPWIEMKRVLHITASALLLAVAGSGCEDAAKKPVQAHVPAVSQAPSTAAQVPQTLAPLPLTDS